MSIKTLAEILAEMGESSVSADLSCAKTKANKNTASQNGSNKTTKSTKTNNQNSLGKQAKPISTPAKNHLADTTTDSPSQNLKQQNTAVPNKPKQPNQPQKRTDTAKTYAPTSHADKQPTKLPITAPDELLKKLQSVSTEPLSAPSRTESYLRWLAFYYLSRRELSQHQLRQKLLAKDCNPDAVDGLLIEFAEKGYQSDERCGSMLVRESIRKGRGRQHIKRLLKSAKISVDTDTLNRLIDANLNQLIDGTVLADDPHPADKAVNWLKLAVAARTRKYGDTIPTTPKDKAKQLRFLQYRGFEFSVCLDALKYRLADLDDE